MDEASESKLQKDREEGGDLQHNPTSALHATNEPCLTEPRNSEVGHTGQKSDVVEAQQSGEIEATLEDKEKVGNTDKEGAEAGVETRPGSTELEMLIVKLKYRDRTAAATQPAHEKILQGLVGENVPQNALDNALEIASVVDSVKQELGNSEKTQHAPSSEHTRTNPLDGISDASIAIGSVKREPENIEELSIDLSVHNYDQKLDVAQSPREHVHNVGDADLVLGKSMIDLGDVPDHVHYIRSDLLEQKKADRGYQNGREVDASDDVDVMHVPGNSAEKLGDRLDAVTVKTPDVGHAEKELDNGGKQQPGRYVECHEEDNRVQERFGNAELPQSLNKGDQLQDEESQQGIMDDLLHEQLDQTALPTEVSMIDQQSYHKDEYRSRTDRSSETSDFTDSESEETENEEEEEEQDNHDSHKANSHVAYLGYTAQDLWNQRHQLSDDDIDFTRASASPQRMQSSVSPQIRSKRNSHQYEAPPQDLQLPPAFHDHRAFGTEAEFDAQNRVRVAEQRKQHVQNLYAAQQSARQIPTGLDQGLPNMPPSLSMPPMDYRGVPQGGYQYPGSLHQGSRPYPGYLESPYGQMPPGPTRAPFPPHGYDFPRQPPIPLTPNDWMPFTQAGSVYPTIEHPVAAKRLHNKGGEVSDDDEPLKTRVKRHPSVMSQDSVLSGSPRLKASGHKRQRPRQGSDSDVKFMSIKPKLKLALTQNLVRMPRPLPQPMQVSAAASPSSSSDNAIGSWALPRYEVQRQPTAKKDDVPSVKVSLPNLVREELLLSPDHPEQEVHLLLNLFLPGQRGLSTPDTAPAVALLNFHTIAVMVVEAFVQFEIGDELGLGRGHLHQNHAQGEDEYERFRDAKDASVDDIFFAVVDRWRAGIESRKQALDLIRGAQEFCDVALDVIYYIKEHGLLQPEPKARQVRSDKGTKRGPRKGSDEDAQEMEKGKGKAKAKAAGGEEKASKGVKRGATQTVNQLQPRKKAKTEKEVKKKARPKPKTVGVTVIRRK